MEKELLKGNEWCLGDRHNEVWNKQLRSTNGRAWWSFLVERGPTLRWNSITECAFGRLDALDSENLWFFRNSPIFHHYGNGMLRTKYMLLDVSASRKAHTFKWKIQYHVRKKNHKKEKEKLKFINISFDYLWFRLSEVQVEKKYQYRMDWNEVFSCE